MSDGRERQDADDAMARLALIQTRHRGDAERTAPRYLAGLLGTDRGKLLEELGIALTHVATESVRAAAQLSTGPHAVGQDDPEPPETYLGGVTTALARTEAICALLGKASPNEPGPAHPRN